MHTRTHSYLVMYMHTKGKTGDFRALSIVKKILSAYPGRV